MNSSTTATHHTLDFNLLPSDKFEHLCLWLIEDSGEYEKVECYGGSGDKGRDVIGYTYDGDLDYFQCKRYASLNYSILKDELDEIARHVKESNIEEPRRIYFVLSSSVSPEVKDRLKGYASSIDLPKPTFWEPIILDKKIKNNPKAKKNFFNISEKSEKDLPQIDVGGLIAYGTQEYKFVAVNHGETSAVDCRWYLLGFNWEGYPGTPTVFNLKPEETIDLRIAMHGDFMKQNPIRELRIHFEFRDSKNNWYYSERLLIPEMVGSQAFYRIKGEAGDYIPARPLTKFSINSVKPLQPTRIRSTRLVSYTHNGKSRHLIVQISSTLPSVWQFNSDELEAAFKDLAERKITQMIRTGKFEREFVVNTYLNPTQKTGFKAYQELRDSISS